MADFKDKDIERVTFTDDGRLDEIVLTGDVHIERLGPDNWYIQAGGLRIFCQDLVLDEVQPELGKVPEGEWQASSLRLEILRWRKEEAEFADVIEAALESEHFDEFDLGDELKTAPTGVRAWAEGSAEPTPTTKEDYVERIEEMLSFDVAEKVEGAEPFEEERIEKEEEGEKGER